MRERLLRQTHPRTRLWRSLRSSASGQCWPRRSLPPDVRHRCCFMARAVLAGGVVVYLLLRRMSANTEARCMEIVRLEDDCYYAFRVVN